MRVPRDVLLEAVWPGQSDRRRRGSLRQALYKLRVFGVRVALDGDVVGVDRAQIVRTFSIERTVAGFDRDVTNGDEPFGVFLPSYAPPTESLEEWVDLEREAVHAQVRHVLVTQLRARRERADWGGAEALARWLLRFDPLHEDATLTIAECTMLSGAKAEAIAILERLGPDAVAAAHLGVASTVALEKVDRTASAPQINATKGAAAAPTPLAPSPAPLVNKPSTSTATQWWDHGPESTCAICANSPHAHSVQAPMGAIPTTPAALKTAAVADSSAASASLVPAMPKAPEVNADVSDEEVVLHFGPRRYRVRGLGKALSAESLKLNVFVSQGEAFHVDTVELYSARQRAAWVKQAADELRVPEDALKRDMGSLLLKLEELQEKQLKEKLAPKAAAPTLSESERDVALELLKSPQLLQRILLDFERCGVVGEETNKLMGYLAAVSRKLDEPLAVLIQSSSAAGKSSLMEAVLAFVPEEDKTKYSAMTGQSLFYMGDADLKHKVLAIVEEEGAARASYALKLLQSEGELTIASTGKDPSSGRLVTHEYRVEGPTQLFLTTTASELDEELLNRCVVLTVDEERGQTQAIHRLQREKQTLEGLLARRDRDAVLKVHKDAQRMLRPLMVANPFAPQLTFLDDRTRRDFPKYLTLIRTIALLHQHQRPLKSVQHGGQVVEYVEVTLEDVATANRLAAVVFGRTLDELAPQARRLLNVLHARVGEERLKQNLARADYRFSRKDVRAWTGWSDFQVRMHLEKLAALEYLLVHRGQRGQTFVYELLYDGKGADGAPFLIGLTDVDQLRQQYDEKNEHRRADFEGPSSIHRAPNEPTSCGPEIDAGAGDDSPSGAPTVPAALKALSGAVTKPSSYAQAV